MTVSPARDLRAGRQRHNDVDAERAWLFSFFRSLAAIGLTAAIALMKR
jgi:hypothetical protein